MASFLRLGKGGVTGKVEQARMSTAAAQLLLYGYSMELRSRVQHFLNILSFLPLDRFAEAEKDLRNPTVNAAAVAGVAPVRDPRLPESYSAAGVNINIPVFNGGLFKARREEAESRAAAASKDVQDLTLLISRDDVRVAWLNANDTFRRLDVTARMVAQANESLRLAQARYDASLGSIVELNTAQLNQTAAQIAAASVTFACPSHRTTCIGLICR